MTVGIKNTLVLGNPYYYDPASLEDFINDGMFWRLHDESIEQVDINHVLEYVNIGVRIHLFNELYRVLTPQGKATIHVPYWSSMNAYSDPFLVWPPITEMSILYLADGNFRARNHLNYPILKADFEVNYGYSYAPQWVVRSDAARDHAILHSINVVNEVVFTLKKRSDDTTSSL